MKKSKTKKTKPTKPIDIDPVVLDLKTKTPFMSRHTSQVLASAGQLPKKHILSH